MKNKKFKILSIDGGGVKGVFPAMFLMLLEDELKNRSDGKFQIYQHFDLITGTSTGGIIAIALALGIPAKEIYNLYLDNAKGIFGKKKSFWFGQIRNSAHEREFLEKLVRNKFKEINDGVEPRLDDCKTDVCIPIYDLIQGNPSVLKTKYHPAFERDYHIPAYQAAMATSAAPTYFNPYTSEYVDLKGTKRIFSNKVDGGVMANNPTLVAFLEAIKAFKVEMSQLEILSLGTGHKKFTDGNSRKRWGLYYWMRKDKRQRLIDLFMQSQSQLVANYISLLYQGIDKSEKDNPNFIYDRIDVLLNEDNFIDMDESDPTKIKNFAELASIAFQHNRSSILQKHFY
ncbi:MAG: patatin [Zunongwangia sp.]|jgi:patatin-like phospholipase/acyl hydrolase|uniref:Patatin n=4 Tax=Flavobacteriaceae TaxID=49546 RepID=A0A0Q9Z599_9FLAO|nr:MULTISPECIES: CBASS cGAMP-activated phospholipase [Flavobacteriaceae]MAC66302.1 patatin [Flavobacteriaceae bacterium]MAO35986.1 patatin [Zunongwangia sp.]ADF54302.1 patatin [Zunongwangia profunda SM-A87]APS38567.1 patatin [Salegentibacter sp. T436]KRG28069.1 patatin [Salegentibacter mishustinae]|tara:strand:+ start:3484 stop:4509 length:1026 start_codon:yes stop_codon:yes gene_type:complete